MFSRRLRFSLALGLMAALFGALIAASSRASWRPVAVDFPGSFVSTEPEYVPVEWRQSQLWVHREPMGAMALGITQNAPK